MDELLLSFEMQPLEGQTQPVYLVPLARRNLHQVPAELIAQHHVVPLHGHDVLFKLHLVQNVLGCGLHFEVV